MQRKDEGESGEMKTWNDVHLPVNSWDGAECEWRETRKQQVLDETFWKPNMVIQLNGCVWVCKFGMMNLWVESRKCCQPNAVKMSGKREKWPRVETKRKKEASCRSRSASSLQKTTTTYCYKLTRHSISANCERVGVTRVRGMMIMRTAFSCTCQPNMKEAKAHNTMLCRKATTFPPRRHNVHIHGWNN